MWLRLRSGHASDFWPINNTHDRPETELLLPMCVSVLDEAAAMCSSVARTGSSTLTWFFFFSSRTPDVTIPMHKSALKYDLEAQNASARSLIPVRSTINAWSMRDVVALVLVYDGSVTPNLSLWPFNQPAEVSKIHSDMTLGWKDQRAQVNF